MPICGQSRVFATRISSSPARYMPIVPMDGPVSVAVSSILVLLPCSIAGGAIAGPFLAGMYDAVLRGLRDDPTPWLDGWKRSWRQNWQGSMLLGAVMGLLAGLYAKPVGQQLAVTVKARLPLVLIIVRIFRKQQSHESSLLMHPGGRTGREACFWAR